MYELGKGKRTTFKHWLGGSRGHRGVRGDTGPSPNEVRVLGYFSRMMVDRVETNKRVRIRNKLARRLQQRKALSFVAFALLFVLRYQIKKREVGKTMQLTMNSDKM